VTAAGTGKMPSSFGTGHDQNHSFALLGGRRVGQCADYGTVQCGRITAPPRCAALLLPRPRLPRATVGASLILTYCSGERVVDRSVELSSQLVSKGCCKLMVSTTGGIVFPCLLSLRRDKDGNVFTETHGKPRCEQHAEFADRAAKNRFEELVLGALREAHAELFDGGAA